MCEEGEGAFQHWGCCLDSGAATVCGGWGRYQPLQQGKKVWEPFGVSRELHGQATCTRALSLLSGERQLRDATGLGGPGSCRWGLWLGSEGQEHITVPPQLCALRLEDIFYPVPLLVTSFSAWEGGMIRALLSLIIRS